MLYATISVLGYSLFPMVPLSLLSAIIKMNGIKGVIFGSLFAMWSTLTAVRFIDSVSIDIFMCGH